jgi:guanylate kinase
MRNNFKIILDADDVLYRCNDYALEMLNRKTGKDFKLHDINKWGSINKEIDQRIKYFHDPEFIRDIPVYDGAKEFVNRLTKVAEVFICTSVEAVCAGERVASIVRDFPNIDPGNILIGKRKDLLNADMMLDDGYHNLERAQVTYPVLYRQPWNHDVTGLLSISNYQEFLTLVNLVQGGYRIPRYDILLHTVSLIGPSGSGKTTIVNKLMDTGKFEIVRSYTSRTRRTVDENYHFVQTEDFIRMKEEGCFFETSSYMGNYYGTSKEDVNCIFRNGKNPLLILDINGAIAMKQEYGTNSINIFIERSKEGCIKSIIERNLPLNETVRRISSLEAEFKNEQFCDLVVRNEELNDTVTKIMEALS